MRNRDGSNRDAALADAQTPDETGWYRHVGSIGEPGVGKSFILKQLIEQRERSVAFDPEWQYGIGRRKNPLPGFTLVHQPGELKQILRARLGAKFKVLYQPRHHPEKHLDVVMALLIEARDVTLGIDEVANFCNANWLPDDLDYICRCGRHPAVSLIWTSQRPPDVATKLRSATQKFFIFRMQEPANLKWAEQRGFTKEQQTHLASLPNREFYAKNQSGIWTHVNNHP